LNETVAAIERASAALDRFATNLERVADRFADVAASTPSGPSPTEPSASGEGEAALEWVCGLAADPGVPCAGDLDVYPCGHPLDTGECSYTAVRCQAHGGAHAAASAMGGHRRTHGRSAP